MNRKDYVEVRMGSDSRNEAFARVLQDKEF